MALPQSDLEWLAHLSTLHDTQIPALRILNDEYELRAPWSYMHPDIFRELAGRLQQVVIAWPQLVVDSIEERLDVEGFRLPDADAADEDMWRVWQDNAADEQSQLGHVDALVMRRSYICVGTNADDKDTPLVTFESPLEVYADVDPRTRKVRAALRRYADSEAGLVTSSSTYPTLPTGLGTRYATLYLPDRTVFYDITGKITELDRDEHGLGAVPVVPLINRARLSDWYGRSELEPVLPLAHAANKIATDMMVAAEFVALPIRGIFGIGPSDLEDAQGNKLTALQVMLGRLLTIPNDDGTAKSFEFTSANLSNFHATINALASLVASIAGLPPHFLGMTTDNPASADAIRSSEARLIKRAERKQRAFGGAYEQAMRIVRRLQSGDWDPKLRQLETIWRDASTPTVAQSADAATKKYTVGLVPLRQTREDLGYTQAQIARMEADDDADAKALKMPTAAEMMQLRSPRLTSAAQHDNPNAPAKPAAESAPAAPAP